MQKRKHAFALLSIHKFFILLVKNYANNVFFNRESRRLDHVLRHAALANVFHSPEYFDIQTALGHKLLYSCCYDQEEPVGIIVGVRNDSGYHQDIIEIGTKSGGLPLLISRYDQTVEARVLKNRFIEHFAQQYFQAPSGSSFIPVFTLTNACLLIRSGNVRNSIDSTVFLDLQREEHSLWMGLNGKCRNAIRYAQRQGVTARIANELAYFERFYHFYKAIRTKRNTKYIEYEELRMKFDAFTRNGLADLWVAFLDETPLAYAFIWKYKRMINFVYGSSDDGTWS